MSLQEKRQYFPLEERATLLDDLIQVHIKNFQIFIALCGFFSGCFESKELIFYFIYTKNLGQSLQMYTKIKALVLVPVFMQIFMGIITDNFSLGQQKKRNYFFMICIIEALAYGFAFFAVHYQYPVSYVIIAQFIAKTMNTWRNVVICTIKRWTDVKFKIAVIFLKKLNRF